MTTEQKNYIISFKGKKKFSGASFYSNAIKHIIKKSKKIPQNLSISIDKILYGR